MDPHLDRNKDPISEKKIKKGKGLYDIEKMLLGFDFDGDAKTMWLESAKQEKLLSILKGWIRTCKRGSRRIPFSYYKSTILKIRHAFKSIPVGCGLLSPCNCIFRSAHHMYTCSGMRPSSRWLRGVKPSSVNRPKNQHGVESWSLVGLITLG